MISKVSKLLITSSLAVANINPSYGMEDKNEIKNNNTIQIYNEDKMKHVPKQIKNQQKKLFNTKEELCNEMNKLCKNFKDDDTEQINKFCDILLGCTKLFGKDWNNLESILHDQNSKLEYNISDMLSCGNIQQRLLDLLRQNSNINENTQAILNKSDISNNDNNIVAKMKYILSMKELGMDSLQYISDECNNNKGSKLRYKFFENLFGKDGNNLGTILSHNIYRELDCINNMLSSNKSDLVCFLRQNTKMFSTLKEFAYSTELNDKYYVNKINKKINNCIDYVNKSSNIVNALHNFNNVNNIQQTQQFFTKLFENDCNNLKTILSYNLKEDLLEISNFLKNTNTQTYLIEFLKSDANKRLRNIIFKIVYTTTLKSSEIENIVNCIKYCINESASVSAESVSVPANTSFEGLWNKYKNESMSEELSPEKAQKQNKKLCDCLFTNNCENLITILNGESIGNINYYEIIDFLEDDDVKTYFINVMKNNNKLCDKIFSIVDNISYNSDNNETIDIIKNYISNARLMQLLNMDISFTEMLDNYNALNKAQDNELDNYNDPNNKQDNEQLKIAQIKQQICNYLFGDDGNNLQTILYCNSNIGVGLREINKFLKKGDVQAYFLNLSDVQKYLIEFFESKKNDQLYKNVSNTVNNRLHTNNNYGYDSEETSEEIIAELIDKIRSCIFLKSLDLDNNFSFVELYLNDLQSHIEEFCKCLLGNHGENLKTILSCNCREARDVYYCLKDETVQIYLSKLLQEHGISHYISSIYLNDDGNINCDYIECNNEHSNDIVYIINNCR